jgi:ribonuclease HI
MSVINHHEEIRSLIPRLSDRAKRAFALYCIERVSHLIVNPITLEHIDAWKNGQLKYMYAKDKTEDAYYAAATASNVVFFSVYFKQRDWRQADEARTAEQQVQIEWLQCQIPLK